MLCRLTSESITDSGLTGYFRTLTVRLILVYTQGLNCDFGDGEALANLKQQLDRSDPIYFYIHVNSVFAI